MVRYNGHNQGGGAGGSNGMVRCNGHNQGGGARGNMEW